MNIFLNSEQQDGHTDKQPTSFIRIKFINLPITFSMDMTIEKYLLFELVKVIVVQKRKGYNI